MHPTLPRIYDGFAETYEANRGLFDMSEVFDALVRRLPDVPGRLLDLGCGAGEPMARLFADRGWAVTGVDFSRGMLAMAARFVPEMETVYGDMCAVDFPAGRFDAVTAVYSLFHVPRDQHPALFRKLQRWLAPGGKALFTYATRDYTGSEAFDGYKEFMGQELYYSHLSPADLYAALEDAGLAVEAQDYREIGGEVFLWMTVSKPAG